MESEVVSKRSAAPGTPDSALGARVPGDPQPSGGREPTTTETEKTVSQKTPVDQSVMAGEDGSGAFAAAPKDQELTELRHLVRSLSETARAVQVQSAHNAAFHDALADVKAATRALMMGPAVVTAGVASQGEQDCDCLPCYCVSERCCSFDIILTDVRVLKMQKLTDSLTLDSAVPWGAMDVRIFASIDIDGQPVGALIPSPFSTVSLHKLATEPTGEWISIGRLIGRVQVPKNSNQTIEITVEATEVEEGLELVLPFNRNETGAGLGSITLNCCVCVIAGPVVAVELTGGGQGGGKIEVRFQATRRC